MCAPKPNYVYIISDRGVIAASSAEQCEVMLRDLWKNVQPWLNEPTIHIKAIKDV
jgi:hypothetical protein